MVRVVAVVADVCEGSKHEEDVRCVRDETLMAGGRIGGRG
jgi:hypothetical protein